ncbi:MAG: UvrD-helicase domain-containing protein [Bacteroidota bacterium]
MSSILPNDSQLRFPCVIVVEASAGSGKTTTLTQRLVQLLLSKRVPHNKLGSILAITFTNNAAVEMKQRVMGLLKKAALGEPGTIEELRGLVSMEDDEIRERAREVLETILDRYSEFQVQTIDSFLARVFKASALEFGFPPGFDIVIDSRPMLDEAFERFAAGITEGSDSAALINDLTYRLLLTRGGDAKFHWNPYRELAREVKNLYGKIVSTARPLLNEDRSGEYEGKGQKLCGLVEELGTTMDRSKLAPSTRFVTYRSEARAGRIDRLLDLKFPNPPATKSKSPQIEFSRFVKSSESLFAEIELLRSELILLHAQNYFAPYVITHRILKETLDLVKRRQGRVDLGDMTLRLAQFVSEGIAPDLYIAIGEKIHHYLIDEFQDTSPIQWLTLMPLIENSLGTSGSLFVVGDMKQSIYGFRGADWRIMRNLIDGKYFPSAPPELLTLGTNFRSGERILDYTTTVFHEIVPFQVMSGAAQASGLATFTQKPRPEAKGKGVVETIVMEGESTERPEREVILRIVSDCLDRGFSLRDIAIITPENEDVVKVSGWLNEAGHEFVPFSTLDIRTRKVVGEILAFLRFLDSPIDSLTFGTFLVGSLFRARLQADGIKIDTGELHGLGFERNRSSTQRPLYILFKERFPKLWDQYFDPLFSVTGYLPLYDLTTHIYKLFGVFDLVPKEEAALVKLLDVVKHFEEQGVNSLAEFIEFAEEISEDSDWNIDVPPDVNAVRIMTVHKAKGLDFRVVVVLLYDVPIRPDRVFMEETEDGVRLVRLVKKHAEENAYLDRLLVDRELRGKVDQLNKLYVALTRAKDEMYVLAVQYPQAKEPSAFLPEKGFEPKKKSKVTLDPVIVQPRATLVHHNLGLDVRQGVERIHLEETKRGETIHNILARIETVGGNPSDDVRKATEAEARSKRTSPAVAELQESIGRFLTREEMAPHFRIAKGRTVFNEQEFARRDGQLFRMDRVVVDAETVTVLDYKTGGEQKDYVDQVRNYMAILREVFPGKAVKGVLAYVDTGVCRGVE